MNTVSDILAELRRVPGAVVDETEHIDRRTGQEEATVIHEPPAPTIDDFEETLAPVDGDRVGLEWDQPEDPASYVEVPPEIERMGAGKFLSEHVGKEIRQKILLHGVDALGWYVTFHQRRYQYGIYIPTTGFLYLATTTFGRLASPVARKAELALHAILRHELMHFAADNMAAQWELAVGKPCWLPAQAMGNSHEEMLANGYMLRGFRFPSIATRQRGAFAQLENFTRMQPEGYKDGHLMLPRGEFEDAWCHLSYRYACCMDVEFEPPLRGYDHLQLLAGWPRIDWRFCPIHIVHDEQRLDLPAIGISLFDSIARIEETNGFRRQLARMGKPLVSS